MTVLLLECTKLNCALCELCGSVHRWDKLLVDCQALFRRLSSLTLALGRARKPAVTFRVGVS